MAENSRLSLEMRTPAASYWAGQLAKADKRFEAFEVEGERVVDRYLLEQTRATNGSYRDKYNILYSSTETIKPSLYGQTPKVQAVKRFSDNNDADLTLAALLAETVTQYCVEEIEFDDVVQAAVEDFTLPGLGQVWLRYDAKIAVRESEQGIEEYIAAEEIKLDYVHWRDFRMGAARHWTKVPWVARRVYFTKIEAEKRFGIEKAATMGYSDTFSNTRNEEENLGNSQAAIWEIWDITSKTVTWFCANANDILDKREDPLKLKKFFPCPKPLRAVSTTKTLVPKSFFGQYRAQAEELDNLTQRIRFLTEALKVRGVFDGANQELVHLLNGPGNKMVPIENWSQFANSGGINGAVQWLPIKDISAVLNELYRQREIVKAEIYEITGFSDIVRGVSKASETLGAQEIKNNWATGRLKSMQREVQRFCRDIIALINEIAFEQFSDDTLMAYSGFKLPQDVIQQDNRNAAMAMNAQLALPVQSLADRTFAKFTSIANILRNEKTRCAMLGIETDSTILSDEQKERQDRMQFLSSIGAYLQQAGPMAMQYPDMRGLLGAIMMFTVNTFRSARPVELAFDEFSKKLQSQPTQSPDAQQKQDAGKNEQVKLQSVQMQNDAKQQLEQLAVQERIQLANMRANTDMQLKQMQIKFETAKMTAENGIRLKEIALKEREIGLKEAELDLKAKEIQLSDEREIDRIAIEAERLAGENIVENEGLII